MFEEVGYRSDQISFVRSGRPQYIDDSSGHLAFAVHPFLFNLSPTAHDITPQLNWENVDAQFLPPSALSSLQTVPGLAETFQRVALTPEQEEAIQSIIDDRTHGAAQLATWVLDAFDAEIARCRAGTTPQNNDDGPLVLDDFRNFGYHLATCRPSMAPLANIAAEVLYSTHTALHNWAGPFECTRDEVCIAASRGVAEARARLAASNERLLTNAQELLQDGMTIMTISKSSSVLAAVEAALRSGERLKAIVCESRPLCEGVSVAESWAAAGAEVTLITDAQAAVFMPQADVVLVGADAIDMEGVHNKAGTRLLALAAQEVGVPFYALADSSKISPGPLADLVHPGKALVQDLGEEKGVEEVTAGWAGRAASGNVTVRNVYFEAAPLPLVKAVVTENGVLDLQGIEKEIDRIQDVYITAFQLQI